MAEENIQNPTPNGDNNVQPTDNQTPKGGEPQVNNTPPAPSVSPDDVQKQVLEQLGVKSLDEAKNALDGFKQWQESQKTEQEKQTEQMGTLQEQLTSVQAEKANLSAKVEALSKGVNPDALEDVIKLVAGEENVGEAIDKLLTKYPHFAQTQATQQQTAPKPTFGQPQYNEPAQSTEADTWKAVMQKFMKR
jgi:hypothetical protein